MTNIHVEKRRLQRILDSGNITAENIDEAFELASRTRLDTDRVFYAKIKKAFEAQNTPKEEPTTQYTKISAEVVEAAKAQAQKTGSTRDRANYAVIKRRYDLYHEQQQATKEAQIKPELDRLKELRDNPYSEAQRQALDKIIATKEAQQ